MIGKGEKEDEEGRRRGGRKQHQRHRVERHKPP